MNSDLSILFSPNRILFGIGCVDQLCKELLLSGANRLLIVTSPGMPNRPFFQQILKDIYGLNVSLRVISSVKPEPTIEDVDDCFGELKTKNIDLVIGIGGGSVMDMAKLVSCRLANKESLLQMAGTDKVKHKGPPVLLIPTLAGSGSEVTHEAVITRLDSGTRFAIKDAKLLASATIVDPQLSASCPLELAIHSGIDAFVHAIESIGNLKANFFSTSNALRAVELLYEGLKLRTHNTKNETLKKLSLGSMLAGFAFGSTGTAAIHAFGYPLTARYQIPHGKANAVMLPYVIAFNLKTCQQYLPLQKMWQTNELNLFLSDFVKELGLPANLRDLGIPKSDLDEMGKSTLLDERHLSVNPRTMTLQDIELVFHAAWEGELELSGV